MHEIGICIYLIFKLGLRIGGEKNPDNNVVGVTSLYKNSIKLLDNNCIKINFIGKDSL